MCSSHLLLLLISRHRRTFRRSALCVCVAVFLFPPKSFHPCLEKQQISRRLPPLEFRASLPSQMHRDQESCPINFARILFKTRVIFRQSARLKCKIMISSNIPSNFPRLLLFSKWITCPILQYTLLAKMEGQGREVF